MRYPEALAADENALELWPTVEDAEALAGVDEVELLRRAAEGLLGGGARPCTDLGAARACAGRRAREPGEPPCWSSALAATHGRWVENRTRSHYYAAGRRARAGAAGRAPSGRAPSPDTPRS